MSVSTSSRKARNVSKSTVSGVSGHPATTSSSEKTSSVSSCGRLFAAKYRPKPHGRHAVQERVHAADAEHGVVEVEAVENVVVEVFLELDVAEDFRVTLAEVFARRHEEAARAAGGIADDVGGLQCDHLNHQPDEVARGSEWAVPASRGNLSEHATVQRLRLVLSRR
jgi:hypothetical protein